MKKLDGMTIEEGALPEGVYLLNDEEFPQYMATTCKHWLIEHIHSGFLALLHYVWVDFYKK